MPLSPGVRVGPYEILAALGAGGMGEVYRVLHSRRLAAGRDGGAVHPNAPRQILAFTLGGTRSARTVVEGRAITTHARVSPDGRWVAFTSIESGLYEVYIQSMQSPGVRWQISTNGGMQPKWRRDGKEIFYLGMDGALVAVRVSLGALAEIGKPERLFKTAIEPVTGPYVWHEYDVSPDAQRFLVNTPEPQTFPLTIVSNWFSYWPKVQ